MGLCSTFDVKKKKKKKRGWPKYTHCDDVPSKIHGRTQVLSLSGRELLLMVVTHSFQRLRQLANMPALCLVVGQQHEEKVKCEREVLVEILWSSSTANTSSGTTMQVTRQTTTKIIGKDAPPKRRYSDQETDSQDSLAYCLQSL